MKIPYVLCNRDADYQKERRSEKRKRRKEKNKKKFVHLNCSVLHIHDEVAKIFL